MPFILPHMLLVGAAGRNAGKTLLACSIIRNVSALHRVIGVKITTVGDDQGACPHGKGCGACASMSGPFSLTEEVGSDPQKDTGRMREAGAARIFWLRARREHLREGIEALMHEVGADAVIVAESTSARAVVEPGLFLLTKRADDQTYKASAAEVLHDVDCIVTFGANTFDLALEDVHFSGESWALREQATAIVMAGGESRRMGTDKAMLDMAGQPMIQRIVDQLRPHFQQILISAADAKKYAFAGVPVIVDREKGRGPLMGIASALEVSSHDLNFVQACDIPRLNMRWVRRMLRAAEGYDAVIPVSAQGREPLYAVYRKRALPEMLALLERGEGRISSIGEGCTVQWLSLPEGMELANLNTPEAYGSYVKAGVSHGGYIAEHRVRRKRSETEA